MYHTRLQVTCDPSFAEILMAEISDAGFDTFMENETGFEAFVEQENFDTAKVQAIKTRYHELTPLEFVFDRIEKKNWNEEWEKNYEPVIVDSDVIVRAGFHQPEKKFPYEIIITPKMSFGTGHHQTTYLMLKVQLQMDHNNKIVMDAGTGTGVLAIMASKRGAQKVEAFDIDDWSVENSTENIQINQCSNIYIRKGSIRELTFEKTFDIILANINKNILLAEMEYYAANLKIDGLLVLSGFYEKDVPDLVAVAIRYSLVQYSIDTRDDWACLQLIKK